MGDGLQLRTTLKGLASPQGGKGIDAFKPIYNTRKLSSARGGYRLAVDSMDNSKLDHHNGFG